MNKKTYKCPDCGMSWINECPESCEKCGCPSDFFTYEEVGEETIKAKTRKKKISDETEEAINIASQPESTLMEENNNTVSPMKRTSTKRTTTKKTSTKKTTKGSTSKKNQTYNQNIYYTNNKSQWFWPLIIGAAVFTFFIIVFANSGVDYEGRWSSASQGWVFILSENGRAHVKCGPFEYDGEWVEDNGTAVISGEGATKAFFFSDDGKVYSLDYNDNASYTGISVTKNR